MNNMTKNNSLIEVSNNSIFFRIKNFFMNLFRKNKVVEMQQENIIMEKPQEVYIQPKRSLMEDIKGISSEEMTLLELQRKYKLGEITEEEMTPEQVQALCDLYDQQNEKLRRSNEYRKQKIMEYRANLTNV